MTQSRQALQIFEQAMQLQGEELEAFLKSACADDASLREDVDSLMSTADEASLLFPTQINDSAPQTSKFAGGFDTPRPLRLQCGAKLQDRYEILDSIGAGGMGEVLRAHDARLDRDVAIKVMNESHSHQDDMHERFRREMKAVAALSHPNIVTLFDFASDADVSFAVMELVEGKTLREIISEGIDWPRVMTIARGIADGLHAAHSRQVMHRDIKPENVMVAGGDQAKILDFGLARSASPLADDLLTEPMGVNPGTVPYMSPEQVDGLELSCATDIFSMGIVVYEMLTGKNPFREATAFATMQTLVAADPPSLDLVVHGLPIALSKLVANMLCCQPEDRPSAQEVLRQLIEIDVTTSPKIRNQQVDRSAVDSSAYTPHGRNNLPVRRIELTGRDKEMTSITQRLENEPIVTVVGAGGVGKTSVAVATAQSVVNRFLGGVWFCEFAPVKSGEDVVDVIAGVLDRNAGSKCGLDELVNRLQGPPTLLVVDNCEHLVDSIADVIEELSARVANLAILVTSRQPLCVANEGICRLDGLACEGTDSDAAALFAARAESSSAFSVNSRNEKLVEQIVRRLEGLPLAIELAAPKLSALSAEELLAALDDQLTTLRGRRRSDGRQGTIDRAISWSFDLLEQQEQETLLALSVFAATFTREAMLEVCGLPARASISLQSLVEQSVIVRRERHGQSCYRMLEPIRQFCQSRISKQANAFAREHHARYYARRAMRLGQGINGHDEIRAAAILNAEWPDIRQAILWGRHHEVMEVAVDPILALARTLMFHLRTEGFQWLIDTEKQFPERLAGRADVAWVIASGYWVMGNPEQAEFFLSRCEESGTTCRSLWVRYLLRYSQTRFEASADAALEAEKVAIEDGDTVEAQWWALPFDACPISMVNPSDPRVDEKLASSEQMLKKLDWPTGNAFHWLARGVVCMNRRELDDAHIFLTQSIHHAAECGNRWIESVAGISAAGLVDPSVPPVARLESATRHLRSLVEMGEATHFPLAVRSVIIGLVDSQRYQEAAKCSAIVDQLEGVGDKNEFSPHYPDRIALLTREVGTAEFERLQRMGASLSVQDIADIQTDRSGSDVEKSL